MWFFRLCFIALFFTCFGEKPSDRARQQIVFTVSTLIPPSSSQYADGDQTTARIKEPCAVVALSNGSLIFSDCGGHSIRLITGSVAANSVVVTTIAGSAPPSILNTLKNARGTNARFNTPCGLAANTDESALYIADYGNNVIRQMTLDHYDVTTFVGTGAENYENSPGQVSFHGPRGLAFADSNTLLVADEQNHVIRQINVGTGHVSTLAGVDPSPGAPTCKWADGSATASRFCFPHSLAVVSESIVYVGETSRVRRISMEGIVTVSSLSGSSASGYVDGQGSARFNGLYGIVATSWGSLLLCDQGNEALRLVPQMGEPTVTTVAGAPPPVSSFGWTDGIGTVSRFFWPRGIVEHSNNVFIVMDGGQSAIRVVTVSNRTAGDTESPTVIASPSLSHHYSHSLSPTSRSLRMSTDLTMSASHRSRSISQSGLSGSYKSGQASASSNSYSAFFTASSPTGSQQQQTPSGGARLSPTSSARSHSPALGTSSFTALFTRPPHRTLSLAPTKSKSERPSLSRPTQQTLSIIGPRSRSRSLFLSLPSSISLLPSTSLLVTSRTRMFSPTASCEPARLETLLPQVVAVEALLKSDVNLTLTISPSFHCYNKSASSCVEVTWAVLKAVYKINSTTLVVAIAAPETVSVTQDHYVEVTVLSTAFQCQVAPVKATVVVRVPASAVSAAVKQSAQTAAVAASSLSSALSTPMMAMQQVRLNAIFALASCTFSHSAELDVLASPSRLGFGDAQGQYYRGAVLGNLGIVVGFCAFVCAVGVGVHLLRKVDSAAQLAAPSFWWTLQYVAFPGVAAIPLALLSQGTVGASVALLRHGSGTFQDVAVAVAGLCAMLGCLFGCIACICQREFDATFELFCSSHEGPSSIKRILTLWVDGTGKWRDTGSGFKNRFKHIFADYRVNMQFFFSVELFFSMCLGVLDGLKPDNQSGCNTVAVGTMIVLLAALIVVVATRPYYSPLTQLYAIFMAGSSLFCAVCFAVGNYASSSEFTDVAEYVTTTAMFIGLAKTLVDLLQFSWWMRKHTRRLLSHWHQTRGPAATNVRFDVDSLGVLEIPPSAASDLDAAELHEVPSSGGGGAAELHEEPTRTTGTYEPTAESLLLERLLTDGGQAANTCSGGAHSLRDGTGHEEEAELVASTQFLTESFHGTEISTTKPCAVNPEVPLTDSGSSGGDPLNGNPPEFVKEDSTQDELRTEPYSPSDDVARSHAITQEENAEENCADLVGLPLRGDNDNGGVDVDELDALLGMGPTDASQLLMAPADTAREEDSIL